MAEYIEREAVEKAVFIKQDQERQHWIEYLKQFRVTADYSSKEQAVDNWLRGYGEAVENLLAIFETLSTADVEKVVRCKDCTFGKVDAEFDSVMCFCRDEKPIYKSVAMGMQALENQIPKKPNLKITGTTGWNTEYRCPTCNDYVTKGYCWHCGQALDWSDTE